MKTTQFLVSKVIRIVVLVLALFITTTAIAPVWVYAERLADARTGRILQVTLSEHGKISQYAHIDSSANGYGKNACGLVAAAAAVDAKEWTDVVDLIAHAAGATYSPHKGIQPSHYVSALKKVYGANNVRELNETSLEQLYVELLKGNRVIVDFKVNSRTQVPSAKNPNYAHFARVLGIDMDKQEIYFENTLRGAPFWTVSFEEFDRAWEYPETTASEIPDWRNAEDVTQWAVVLDAGLAEDQDF
jgi:hypothetical protein